MVDDGPPNVAEIATNRRSIGFLRGNLFTGVITESVNGGILRIPAFVTGLPSDYKSIKHLQGVNKAVNN